MTIDAQMLKKFEKMTEGNKLVAWISRWLKRLLDLLCSICNTIMEDPHALHCG